MRSIVMMGLLVWVVLLLGSCSTVGSALREGISEGIARSIAGSEETGEMEAEEEPPGVIGPQWYGLATMQAQVAFAYTFSLGGYWLGQRGFAPGEWVSFRITTSEGDELTAQRALLGRRDDGKEWWRVRYESEAEEWIFEGLVDPEAEELLRLLARDPEGTEGEVPVEKGTWVQVGTVDLTEESIEGAVVGTERITVPAGSFTARHLRYTIPGGDVSDWWLVQSVPGGVVKWTGTTADGERVTCELLDYGTDARPLLVKALE
ncbi:hypothetical protein Spith_2123 [Spirochaeta thermophila DSM 6578]|uniref:Lipoprotein n=1 Tax=Winmispira thermophila (strain ATCC 700085 / DSM 6578 / Z-1203) TaxID=869211 RepID=G0GF34_WINT7|nr:hypothetical protein [Spirochaeta thermophila]AEJ62378.1 hypothetical protein Spith_2123 [Spirochaeta thermophila DSM 6578]